MLRMFAHIFSANMFILLNYFFLRGLADVVFPFVCFIREHFRSFDVERPIKI